MVAAAKNNLIAIHNDEALNRSACGRIVWWALQGEISVAALRAALENEDSTAKAPKNPSDVVCLHRAVEAVAKATRSEAHATRRGTWCIVGKPEKRAGELAYAIRCEAALSEGSVYATGAGSDLVERAFAAAHGTVTANEIGHWLCDCLDRLGAVALRDRGGVYFVPRDRVEEWDRIVRALKASSAHVVHAVPAMKSAEAVDAILAAITADTRAAVESIDEDIHEGGLQIRGLRNRQAHSDELFDRLVRYESLLGIRLDDLRSAITDMQSRVATAIIMASTDDA